MSTLAHPSTDQAPTSSFPVISRRSFAQKTVAASAAIAAAVAIAPLSEAALASESAGSDGKASPETDGAKVASPATTTGPSNTSPAAAAPAWLGEEPADGDIVETKECDLLIVGAGNGGMVAAATASDLGMDFLLAEAFDTPSDTRHWIGAINSTYTEATGAHVDVRRLQYELARYASFKCNQRLHKMWIDESAELVEWLGTIEEPTGYVCVVDTDLGPEIDPTCETGNYISPQQHMFLDPTTMNPMQTDLPSRNEELLSHVEATGNADRVLWNHTLLKLVHAGGVVSGAIFETEDGNVQVNAKNVILATGGYGGNPEMLAQCAPLVAQCCTTMDALPKNKGVGIKAGMWAGGIKDTECAPMVFNRGPVAPGVSCGPDENGVYPGPHIDPLNFLGSQPFLKVARTGRRFANESCPYDFICFAAAQQPGGVWALVCDANAAQDIERFATAGCSKVLPQILASGTPFEGLYAEVVEQGLMLKAETLEELAEKMGLDADAQAVFLEEVARYNDLYDAQEDSDFGKEAYRLSALRTPPFYAQWYGGNLLTTCDGLCIDKECRVIDADCKPIEGLYAIGDCSGSFFANNYPEYLIGVAVGRTLTEARHVVRRLAGDL